MKQQSATPGSSGRQAGFTIVELMIATTVFSMVLLVIIYGVLSFTRAYYSGVNSSTTQDTARNVMNTVAQAIEFSGNVIRGSGSVGGSNPAYYFCAGGSVYYYIPGVKFDATQPVSSTNPGLYVDPGACGPAPTSFSDTNGKELLGNNMRVTYLSLVASPTNARLYTIGVGLSYGDADLLCNNSIASGKGSCKSGSTAYGLTDVVQGTSAGDVVCKLSTGSQYCAHAGLSTTVSLRVSSSELAP